ncbi:MAG: hypothetical protein IKB50_00720 [Clostridia bacterium]|nr:hypothetical protein [Clostridia bacterium]
MKNEKKERVLSVDGRNGLGGAGRAESGIGMKWYKLLLIILIFGTLDDISKGLQFLTGLIYAAEGLDPSAIYATYPMVKIFDVVYGIVVLLFALFKGYVWWQLKGMKKNVPLLIIVLYVAPVIPSVVYNLCCGFAVGKVFAVVPGILANIAVTSSIVCLSHIYFSKRKHLFVN